MRTTNSSVSPELDEPFAVDIAAGHRKHGNPTAFQQDTGRNTGLVTEGLKAGQRIAKISVITLVAIGIAELAVGQISGSIVATADGIDSLSDALISLVVFLGLRLANRPANIKFPFG